MASNSSSEKTEPASPFKLKEAKKRGQVAKSLEVISLFTLVGFLLLIVGMGNELASQLLKNLAEMLDFSEVIKYSNKDITGWVSIQAQKSLYIIIPVMMLSVVFAALGNLIQTGFIFSASPLKPSFDKLNPISGLKKMFSLKTIFDLFKTIIKIAVLIGFLYFFINSSLTRWLSLANHDPSSAITVFIESLIEVLAILIPLIAAIALLDLLFTRKSFLKQMKMTKQEVKDEIKRRDGDPKIKQKIKELQQELRSKSSGLGSVPSADVIVTNPTHISVALKYTEATMLAPKVIAKGKGETALVIREIARKHNIRITQSPPLARMLYKKSKIDSYIPVESYVAVAKLFGELRKKS
ncbi:flagellar biosynthesis protein FlhB [uncultured Microbulbifer sp.]|uniref:flagellar biosynthesis protein FlhB n=1 Tax=uncultured Microbulbifer sp. TaxID=348147 RepID=UPI0026110D1C|nr:flagellar biosynthesis protein FlhB [uncultured Microbulbifer sp.]